MMPMSVLPHAALTSCMSAVPSSLARTHFASHVANSSMAIEMMRTTTKVIAVRRAA